MRGPSPPPDYKSAPVAAGQHWQVGKHIRPQPSPRSSGRQTIACHRNFKRNAIGATGRLGLDISRYGFRQFGLLREINRGMWRPEDWWLYRDSPGLGSR